MMTRTMMTLYLILGLNAGDVWASSSSASSGFPPPPVLHEGDPVFYGEMAKTDGLYINLFNQTPHNIKVTHSGQIDSQGIRGKCIAGLCQLTPDSRIEIGAGAIYRWTLPISEVPTTAGFYTMQVMGRASVGLIPSVATCTFKNVRHGNTLKAWFKMDAKGKLACVLPPSKIVDGNVVYDDPVLP